MIQPPARPPNHRGDILFAFALGALAYLAWQVRDVLVLLYVSALFAVVLTPIVQFISAVRIGSRQPFRRFPVFILLLIVIAALTGFGFLAFPPVLRDLESVGGEMPSRLPSIASKVINLPFINQLDTDQIASRIEGFASQAATALLLSVKKWASDLAAIVTGIVLTIYFIADGNHAYSWFLSFFPLQRRERLDRTLRQAGVRMGKWLLGQASLMLILGLTSTLVYLSLHLRYPYALGVLTGMLNIIPVLGAAVSIGLALIVAAFNSWQTMLGVAIFYVVYLWVENSFLTPRIMKNSVDLPGLAILIGLLLGSALGGIPGAMVAIPTTVLVAVLIGEYLVYNDDAADPTSAPPPPH